MEGGPSDSSVADITASDSTVGSDASGAEAGPSGCYQNTPFTPYTWQQPTPLHQNACSPTQLSAYVTCITSPTADCSAFRGDPANAGCDACIETDIGATAFGPVVTYGGIPVEANWGGCAASFDGNVGATGCGFEINSLNSCIVSECGACPDLGQMPSPMTDQCVATAEGTGGQCAQYDIPSCISELNDGGVAAMCPADFGGLLSLWCGP